MVEKLELRRTGIVLLVVLTTIIVAGLCTNLIFDDLVALVSAFSSCIVGCILINFIFKYYDKRIKKWLKDNSEQVSLDSSNL